MSMSAKYAMQKRRRMYDGGQVTSTATVDSDKAKMAADSMKKAFGYAKGGDVECHACKGGMCYEHGGSVTGTGMVDNIMRKRMAKGGEVEPMADFESDDFDYLDTHPAPDDADYTGANSGDHLGNERIEENDRDIVSRIMRSRHKKDKMPRPA